MILQNKQDPPAPDLSKLVPVNNVKTDADIPKFDNTVNTNEDNFTDTSQPPPDLTKLVPVSDEEQKKRDEKYKQELRISELKAQGIEQVTEDEITNRIDEINIEVEKIKSEQARIAKEKQPEDKLGRIGLFGTQRKTPEQNKRQKDIDYLTDEIKNLQSEKKDLQQRFEKEYRPITKNEKRLVENGGYGLFASDNIANFDIDSEIGHERAVRASRELTQEKMDILSKEKIQAQTPEAILSFDNLLHGKAAKLKHFNYDQIDKLWDNITSKKEYQNSDYKEKRTLIDKEVKQFVKDYNSNRDSENKIDEKQVVANITGNYLTRFASTPDGRFTAEGLKLFAEQMLEQLSTVQKYTKEQFGPLSPSNVDTKNPILNMIDRNKYRKELESKYGKENVDSWYQSLEDESKQYYLAKHLLEYIIALPEAKNGMRDIGKALKSVDYQNLINLGGTELANALGINRITKKLAEEKQLSFTEDLSMKAYATLNYGRSLGKKGTAWEITEGLVNMLPYVVTFGGTTPVYDVARKGALKAIAPVTRSLIARDLPEGIMARLADFASLNAARLSGSAAQAVVMPHMYVKNTLENIRDDVVLSPEMNKVEAILQKNTGDSFIKGATKGYLDTFFEMAFERSGEHLMKAIPGAARLNRYVSSKITGKKFIEKNVLDGFMKMKGISKITDLADYVTKHNFGWNKVLEEYAEEFATDFFQRPLAGQKVFDKDFLHRQLVTFMTVGIFGGPMKLMNVTASYAVGNNVMFTVKDKKTGETKDVGLPQKMYNDLMKVFKEDGVLFSQNNYKAFLDKWDGKMTPEQEKIVRSFTSRGGTMYFKTKDKEGKEKKIGLPRHIYNDLVDIFDEEGVVFDHNKYTEFIDKWKDRLSVEQFKLITSLTINKGKEKLADFIAKKGPGGTEQLPVKNFNPKIVHEDLSEKEIKQVNEENKKVEEQHPDLVREGLIIQDPISGQYIVPDLDQINQMYKQVEFAINNKAEFDKNNNIINSTPELDQLVKQREILKSYQGKLANEKVPYQMLSAEDKHARLVSDLKNGNELKGKSQWISNDAFEAKLDDGRSIKVPFSPNLTEKEQKDVEKAILKNDKVELKLQDAEEFNPDLSITDKYGLPYYSRVEAYINGKPIGAVNVRDFKEGRSKQVADEKAKNALINKISDDINKAFGKGFENDDVTFDVKAATEEEEYKYEGKGIDLDGPKKYPKTFEKDYYEYLRFYDNWLIKNKLRRNNIYTYKKIRDMLGKPENEFMRTILEPVSEFLEQVDANIVFTRIVADGASALYDPTTNTIRISTDAAANYYAWRNDTLTYNRGKYTPEDALVDIFNHESVHAFTALRLMILNKDDRLDIAKKYLPKGFEKMLSAEDKKTGKKIIELYKYVKKHHPELGKRYGLQDVYEFVAESFSNMNFVSDLVQVKVPGKFFKNSNIFTNLVQYVLDYFGFGNKHKTAYEAILRLSKDFGSGHKSFPRPDQSKIDVLSIVFGTGYKKAYFNAQERPDNKNQITDDNKDQVVKNFLDSLNNHDWSQISSENYISVIYSSIDSNQLLSAQDKGYLKAFTQDNEEKIVSSLTKKALKSQGLTKKAADITLTDVSIPEIKGIGLSGAAKINAILDGYSQIWRDIADAHNVNKEIVENKFYRIARQKNVNEKFASEAIYRDFLDSMYGDDIITDAIIDVLRQASMGSAVSMFNFYSNLYLGKKYGLYFNKGSFSMKLLNPSEKYDEFVDRFQNRVKNYTLRINNVTYTGFEGLRKRILMHNANRDKRFRTRDWTWYDNLSLEEKEKLRRDQHEADIQVLSEVTGISTDIWEQYFSEQTKETYANEKGNLTQRNYKTYDNLLSKETYRGKHRRIQSNIAFNLGLTTWFKDERRPAHINEFSDNFNKFFLEGNEDLGVMSNLYKLSTAINTKDEIGQRGIDIKSDNFNSFIQSSNISDIAENILNNNLNNPIVKYYKKQNKEIELVYLNGIHNLEVNRYKKGTDEVKMSNEDLWIAQFNMFLMGADTYLHWIGQMGDKPALTFIEVPKIEDPTELHYADVYKELPDFDDIVKWFTENYINTNTQFIKAIYSEKKGEREEEKKKKVKAFLYNFIMNIKASNELFFGDKSQYKDYKEMVKRAGSSNSPGYRLNEVIPGGVGKDFRFVMINDDIDNIEEFDGIEFMSGDYAKKMQVSMGDMFSKQSEENHEILNSVKCLTSFNSEIENNRSLTKTNRLNIDLLADVLGGKYAAVRDFMRKNKIDVLSFQSGVKKHENGKNKELSMVHIWDKKTDKKLKKPVIPDGAIVIRLTKHVFIQQDLRHSAVPVPTKVSSQLVSNILVLKNGPVVSRLMHRQKAEMIFSIEEEFRNGELSDVKKKWLIEEINRNTQSDIAELLDEGMTPYEPALSNFLRRIISSRITSQALEIPVNRTTAQEIPDVDGLLQGRRPFENHILLPDIAANIEGARYEDNQFEGHIDEAIAHIRKNKKIYSDLFDENGELMEWEIRGRNGIIPGEPAISTRTPASDLHSHTVGRLKIQLPGNFVMLDRKSQLASGSDFDGDQRFTQTLFKSKNGIAYYNNSLHGLSNQIMRLIMKDYMDPQFDEKISRAINKDAYNDIISKYEVKQLTDSFIDPRNIDDARNKNIVGSRMKGIFTDATTTYSIIANRHIDFKNSISIPVGKSRSLSLTGIVGDPIGLMKSHFDNILNLAFDNAADPKIEIMGLNEITSNMWVIAFIGNKQLDTTNDDAIIKHIDDIVSYFASPIMRKFTQYMRKNKGGLEKENLSEVQRHLVAEFGKQKADAVIRFYNAASEFPKIRSFYGLTQKTSNSIAEHHQADILYEKMRLNNNDTFKFIDVRNLFEENGNPITEFAIVKDILAFSNQFTYRDSFIYSKAGKEIADVILNRLIGNTKKTDFNLTEFNAVEKGLSNYAALKAIAVKKKKDEINDILLRNLDKLRKEFPDNLFLSTVQKVFRNKKWRLEIMPGYRNQPIGSTKLKQIQADFDKLYNGEKGERRADYFAAHAILNWGTTTSTMGGSFYSLFGKEYRVMLSAKVQNVLSDWMNNKLTALEKYDAMNWVLSNTGNKALRNIADQNFESKEDIANETFKPDTDSNVEPKNMLGTDAMGEAFATEDTPLQEFIMARLKKMYPGVVFFTDHKAFMEFVKKWGGRMQNVSPHAIGHAFKNAVYIDPKNAVQSTLFHELGHIYWDALPDNHKVKNKLRSLFKQQYSEHSNDDLDEEIILDIGRAGTEMANIKLRGSLKEKFLQLLKEFWSSVKVFFDFASKKDMIRVIAKDIWKNEDNINPVTTKGEATIRNMAWVESSSESVSRSNDINKTHLLNDVPIPSVTNIINTLENQAFSMGRAAMAKAKKQEEKEYRLTKRHWTERELNLEAEAYLRLWGHTSLETGNAIHEVARVTFTNQPLGITYVRNHFGNNSMETYLNIQTIFEKMRDDLLKQYPNGKFISEKQITSKESFFSGIPDLIFNTGVNNEIFVFDFKTTKKEFADENMKPLQEYKTAFGMLRAPFQNVPNSKYTKHMLQLNLYANVIEEKKVPGTENEKYVVKKLVVVPIFTEVDQKTSFIIGARMLNNVNIPRNEKTKDITKKILKLNKVKIRNAKDLYPEYQQNLIGNNTYQGIIADMLKAFHFFSIYTDDIKNITKSHIGDIRHAGISDYIAILLSDEDAGGMGYDKSDLVGPDALNAEELFNIVASRNNPTSTKLTRDVYLGKKDPKTGEYIPGVRDTMYFDHVISSEYVAKAVNPEKKNTNWHRLTDVNTEYILKDVGYENMKVGDNIVAIYDLPKQSKREVVKIFHYTVLEIDKKKKTIEVKDEYLDEEYILKVPGKTDGFLKRYNELPKGVKDPGENSYVPSYLYEDEPVIEKHWRHSKAFEKSREKEQTGIGQSVNAAAVNRMWRFFENNKTWADFYKFFENKENVDLLYQNFNTVDHEILPDFIDLIMNESINHLFAESIRKEHQSYNKIPTHILPQTLNMYYIFLNDRNAVWNDFNRFAIWRGMMPPRMIEAQYFPLNLFTSQAEAALREFNEDIYDLNLLLKDISSKGVDYDVIQIEQGESLIWVKPNEIDVENFPNEKKFLEVIYDFNKRFNADYKAELKEGRNPRLRVSQTYATRNEFRKKYSSKFADIMYSQLKPKVYDNINLYVIDYFNKDGTPHYVKNKGKKVIATLREIKEGYAESELTEIQQKEFFGSLFRFKFAKIPGTVTSFGGSKSGILNYQIKKAQEIFTKGGDDINRIESISNKQKTIPIIGRGKTPYATEYYLEAEERSISSMIRNFHLKPLMAPLDWMIQNYKSRGNAKYILEYLQEWGEYQLYNMRPKHISDFGGQTVSDVIDFANRANSASKMLYSIPTQINNFLIGQTLDVMREPGAYAKGVARLVGKNTDKNPIKNIKKAANILSRYSIANVTSEALFDQLEKEYRFLGMDLAKIEKHGYAMMEGVEKLNQFTVFVGLMTDKEWNAYNYDGTIKDPSKFEHLSDYRKLTIIYRVNAIHGDYGAMNAAPFWFTNLGKSIMPFKKWLPAMIWTNAASYHIDRNFAVRSGVMQTTHLLAKWITYNVTHTEKKQKERSDRIQQMIRNGDTVSSTFFETTDQYFNALINNVNGGKVKFKDLSPNDRRNLWTLTSYLGFGVTMAIFMLNLDDEDNPKYYAKRTFIDIMQRYQGDVFYLYTLDNWIYAKENTVPAFGLFVDTATLFVDLYRYLASKINVKPDAGKFWTENFGPALNKKAYYSMDTPFAQQGEPKFIVQATRVIPMGSALRWAKMKSLQYYRNNTYVDLAKYGLTDEKLEKLDMEGMKFSKMDIVELNFRYKRVMSMINDAAMYLANDQDKDAITRFVNYKEYAKLEKQSAKKLVNAIKMTKLQQNIDEKTIEINGKKYTISEIQTLARIYRNLQIAQKNKSKKEIKEKGKKAIEEYQKK